MQVQLGHSDIRTTLNIYTQTLDVEVLHMANEVTNRLLQLGKEAEPGSIQWHPARKGGKNQLPW